MRFCHLRALLIIYFIILSHSLKMATSKPKHVDMFSYIAYIIDVLDYN